MTMQPYSQRGITWLHYFFTKAFNVGAMPESKRCQQCGREGNIDKHHPNYNHPLTIVFLCRRCHKREHYPGWLLNIKSQANQARYQERLKTRPITVELPIPVLSLPPESFESEDYILQVKEESFECISRTLEDTRKLSGTTKTFRF